jgi:hypothetical protein
MNSQPFTIRVMSRDDVDIAIEWAALEGWNPGLYDASCFYQADPNGFFIGCLGEEPVATISAVKYGGAFGFIGFFIVKPGFRDRRYGIHLGKAGLAHLAGCTIGLDGVLAKQTNYSSLGFEMAYRNVRYQGLASGGWTGDNKLVPLACYPFEEVLAYDRPFFPGPRNAFLSAWIKQPQSAAFGLVVSHGLAGYGVIRRCRSGYKIGPLFADTPEFADLLYTELVAHVPEGSQVFLDIPMVNAEALALAERHQMVSVFETARMYLGTPPALPLSRLYGVTTFELG